MSLSRRQFLFSLSAGVVAGMQFERLRSTGDDPEVAAPSEPAAVIEEPTPSIFDDIDHGPEPQPAHFAGASLAGWRTVLGDARHTATGLAPVKTDDVSTEHLDDRSLLVANRHGRGVMAHNTTYFRRLDEGALNLLHRAEAEIRTPTAPRQISGLPNGQTVEMALFVWDGANSRTDIGLALQWVVNPWSEFFGAVRTWQTNPDGSSEWSPEPKTWITPTDEWQHVTMMLDPMERVADLTIGGESIEAQCAATSKPDNWAMTMSSVLAIELISIWPDQRLEAPTTTLECRNWSWATTVAT